MKIRPTLLRGYPPNYSRSIKAIERRLERMEGRSVSLRFLPALTADGRRLYSNSAKGQPVHAGAFIRKRRIVLDRELAAQPRELARVLVHELFHFVWARLGNPARRSYEALLSRECELRARGELGWSAEWRKLALASLSPAADLPAWRDYLCESFCDTAAWIYSGVRSHPEYTLAPRHRNRREQWFRSTFGSGPIRI